MKTKLFIDTDVVIDFLTDRTPFANAASELFDMNERGQIQVFLSALSINNIYYIVRKYLGRKKTLEIIKELVEITDIIGTGKEEIIRSLSQDFKDFEDSIQYATASGIDDLAAIITRNTKDYTNSEIAVFTPEDFLKTF
jgi:predicted nucleic acid-binding protein